jgi:hypothetical protein
VESLGIEYGQYIGIFDQDAIFLEQKLTCESVNGMRAEDLQCWNWLWSYFWPR